MSESSGKPRQVLVIAAHPDDEVIGMGGTLARHRASGDDVSVLYLSDGVSSRTETDSEHLLRRRAAAAEACRILDIRIHGFQSFPDNSFDAVPLLEVAKAVEAAKNTVDPDLIYTHHGGDLNIDHRVTCQAVLTAFRPQPRERYTELLSFEVSSSTEWAVPTIASPFLPDTYVDTSRFLERAIAAYACYREELRDDPHARSLEALRYRAFYRGRQVGMDAAEAFVTLRRLLR